MSRNKRAQLEQVSADPFALTSQPPDTSMPAVADALYGTVDKIDEHRKTGRPVDIFDIQRHPAQPRRAIPHAVMKKWQKFDVSDISSMFEIWLDEIAQERGGERLDLDKHLDEKVLPAEFDESGDHPDIEVTGEQRPLESTFLKLVSLAVSIRKNGLTNPITVVFLPPDRYQLETGERRWLAYHLLYLHTRDERFSKISAREVNQIDVWRQATENNARAGLNAISRARQLSVLLMDVLTQEKQIPFTAYDACGDELGFYSQVADGESYRIPRNYADKLLNAIGLRSKKQLREYRALLRLPSEVWKIADDLNWTERFIRDMVSDSGGDENRLIQWAWEEARKTGYSVPTGTVSRKSADKKQVDTPQTRSIEPAVVGTPKYVSRFQKLVDKARSGKEGAAEEALACVQEMQLWLEEQKRLLYQDLKRH